MLGQWWWRMAKRTAERDFLDPLRSRIGEAALMAQRGAREGFQDLWDAEVQVYSQWGEDGILSYLCDCLSLVKPRAIELGAGNFLESNTRFLAEVRHASVVAVDSREDLQSSMNALPSYWRNSIWSIRAWITPESVPQILETASQLMGGLNILSLDIDGNDYWVAEQIDCSGIKIIMVEYNPLLGHRIPVAVPRDNAFTRSGAHYSWLYFGASLPAWVFLFGDRGYSLVGTNRAGNNAFFCQTADLDLIPLQRIDSSQLEKYVDSRLRDSRGNKGELTYLTRDRGVEAIAACPVIDVTNSETLTVGDLW